jgi:chemotaxis protein CheX
MTAETSHFIQFSKPFVDNLKETFEMMVQTQVEIHNPKIKDSPVAKGDITSMIGMSGTVDRDGKEKNFKGLLAITFEEPIYIKLASRMLMEEYTEYCDDISDAGSEICNIVMGNAKNGLTPFGFKLGMASPSTVRGQGHEIKYPPKTTVIEVTCSTDIGDFTMELCYQEY